MVEVVGSRVRGLDPQGIAPVIVIDRPQMERTGVLTVAEVLQQLPMDNGGTFNDRDALAPALGAAGLSFRGLGANSVLILINGRRATTHGFPHVSGFGSHVSFVDLNMVPLAAVERIEVLKDGASALYGSDAMAAVINIVLRESLTGIELDARYGSAGGAGAVEQAVSAAGGWQGQRTSVSLIASFTDRDGLAWADRAISQSANHEQRGGVDLRSLSASNFLMGGGAIIGNFGGDCETRGSEFETVDDENFLFDLCVYDLNADIAVPSARRSGLTALVTHEFDRDMSLRFEASHLDSRAEGRRDPASLSNALFPAANPWNPFGVDVLAEYRFTEAGPRVDRINTDNSRLAIVLEGALGTWRWEAAALGYRSVTVSRGEGYLSASRIEAALRGVDLNGDGILQEDEYLNLFSSASNPNGTALLDTLYASTHRRATSRLRSFDLQFSGPVFSIGGRDARAAIGIERGHESIDDRSDPLSLGSLLAAHEAPYRYFGMRVDVPIDEIDPYEYIDPWDVNVGIIEPTGFPTVGGRRDRSAFFGELHVPMQPRLHLHLALRYEHYSGFDASVDPRIALHYDATRRFRVRASWGEGFRAPSLAELYAGPTARLQASWDPIRCPEPGFLLPEVSGCVARSFVTTTAGNASLEAEVFEAVSIGFDFQFSDRYNASLDCWRTDVDDRIAGTRTAWLLRNEGRLPLELVVRDPVGSDDADLFIESTTGLPPAAGFIAEVRNLPMNLGRQQVKGCDAEFSATRDTAGGALGAHLLATHMSSNKLGFRGEESEELAGSFGFPKNRATVTVFWSRRTWEAGVYGRWTDGFADVDRARDVASHVEWDARLTWSGWRSARLSLGVENLFDNAPPFAIGAGHLQGFPVQYYDMRGRFIYAQARFSVGGASSAAVR